MVADGASRQRRAFERFLEERYIEAFDARLSEHYPLIAGIAGADGRLLAAAGLRFAEDEQLFLEHYLDHPVETVVGLIHGETAERRDIVEIGSLASRSSLATVDLFSALASSMSAQGRRFAVATLTPRLQSLLVRMEVQLLKLADADPARVACSAEDWGSYYRGAPAVMTGRIDVPPAVADLQWARRACVADNAG